MDSRTEAHVSRLAFTLAFAAEELPPGSTERTLLENVERALTVSLAASAANAAPGAQQASQRAGQAQLR